MGTFTFVVALLCAGLVAWDYLRPHAVPRLAAIALALLLLFFSQPLPYRALRRAAHVPPEERVTHSVWGNPPRRATEFQSGVFTFYQYVLDDMEIGRQGRAVGVAVLTLLAITPLLRRRRSPGPTGHA